MITTLLFDFSFVLVFPQRASVGVSQQYHRSKLNSKHWQKYLTFNEELIDFVDQNSARFTAHIFSASSPQMLSEMEEVMVPPFTSLISAQELQLSKSRPESYQTLAEFLDVPAEEILFTDDSEANIAAAKIAGFETIHFTDNKNYIDTATKILRLV